MTTIEKMFLIKKLMDEVESEVIETAKNIEDIDMPLYRMLAEGCADAFKQMSKNLNSPVSDRIDTWSKQLNHAYKISKK